MLINKVSNKLGVEPLGYVSAHQVFIKHCINILLNFLLPCYSLCLQILGKYWELEIKALCIQVFALRDL